MDLPIIETNPFDHNLHLHLNRPHQLKGIFRDGGYTTYSNVPFDSTLSSNVINNLQSNNTTTYIDALENSTLLLELFKIYISPKRLFLALVPGRDGGYT